METWSTHHLLQEATKRHSPDVAYDLCYYAQGLIEKGLPVIFTLGHLSGITGVDYRMLRETVNRRRENCNYRIFKVKKRSKGIRVIHSVSGDLFRVQQFINQSILQACLPHPCSFAFHKTGGIRICASKHCGAKWLFQYDLTDFFYDVTEIDVYNIFCRLGYRNLLSFELARLCTTINIPSLFEKNILHLAASDKIMKKPKADLFPYPDRTRPIGVLPQGAPTSPMLSNLAARTLDDLLNEFSLKYGFVYTRYADDITISASYIPKSVTIGDIHRGIIHIIRKAGFLENRLKTRIAGPGAKKVVLGLLVDGPEPRLSKEMYHRIDRHLYACLKYGLKATADHEKFDSAFGYYNHLSGLIAFVKDVDKKRWSEFRNLFEKIPK